MKPDSRLQEYIEQQILPRYASFDAAHGIDHPRTVIAQSLVLTPYYDVNTNMVYAIAAYHDTGLAYGRAEHHLHSGKILTADTRLREWFTEEQITQMREAVEDHRASAQREPRSIYGRIVAEADRCIDPQTIIRRTVQYGLANNPELDREGHCGRCLDHLRNKYGDGGYLRLWIPESDNAQRLEELRCVIRNEARLRALFDVIFEQESR